jgi:hypothetical protein
MEINCISLSHFPYGNKCLSVDSFSELMLANDISLNFVDANSSYELWGG